MHSRSTIIFLAAASAATISAIFLIPSNTAKGSSTAPSAYTDRVKTTEVAQLAGRTLSLDESLLLESIARRVASMMSEFSFASTRVWPHGVLDHKGRLGLFLSSRQTLLEETDPLLTEAKQAWVVFGLIAAVKYSEGSQLAHIAFTDRNGESGESWYYDISIEKARHIHELMIRGLVQPRDAYKLIESAWEKVTSNTAYAFN
jgi:hypothetical protein